MAKNRKKPHPSRLQVEAIEARSIVLTDECGTERIVLSCTAASEGGPGMAQIQVKDDSGKTRAELMVSRDGSAILLLSADGDSRVGLGAQETGAGATIADDKGRPTIQFGVHTETSGIPDLPHPYLTVFDFRNRQAWAAFNGTYPITDPDLLRTPDGT